MYKYHWVQDCPSGNIEYQSLGVFCSSPHNQHSLSLLSQSSQAYVDGVVDAESSRSSIATSCDCERNDGLDDDLDADEIILRVFVSIAEINDV